MIAFVGRALFWLLCAMTAPHPSPTAKFAAVAALATATL